MFKNLSILSDFLLDVDRRYGSFSRAKKILLGNEKLKIAMKFRKDEKINC